MLLPPMGRGVARAAEAAEEDDDPLFLGLGPSEEDEVEPGEVFCNRELAMSTVEAIGFDMDISARANQYIENKNVSTLCSVQQRGHAMLIFCFDICFCVY